MRAFLASFFLGSLLVLASCDIDDSGPGGNLGSDPQDTRGTAEDPWEVSSLAELQSIATGFQSEGLASPLSLEESLAAHYVLTANIDASSTAGADYNGGAGFLPIGNCGADNACGGSTSALGSLLAFVLPFEGVGSDDVPFRGSFDSGGYSIRGLTIDRGDMNGVGLFGALGSEGVVRDLGLEEGDIRGRSDVGGLVGYALGRVVSSYSMASVAGSDRVGGLVGYSGGGVQDGFSAGAVSGDGEAVGGLVGHSEGAVQASYSMSAVGGEDKVGGLVGYSEGSVQDGFSAGAVSGDGEAVGGLVGENAEGSVERAYCVDSSGGEDCVGSDVGGSISETSRVSLGGLLH